MASITHASYYSWWPLWRSVYSTEAGAIAAFYALFYGVVFKTKTFMKEIMPTTIRTMNLTAVVFLLGCVVNFQFYLANMGWPQQIAEWVGTLGLSKHAFLFTLMASLLFLSMFLIGVAILLFDCSNILSSSFGIGSRSSSFRILTALAIEIEVLYLLWV